HDRRLPRRVKAMQVRHRWIERKEIVERQRRRLAVGSERLVAAQRDPVGIADRRHHGEAVERAAQYHDEHARIAAFGAGELRQMRPGEQHARAEQQLAAGISMEAACHDYLRWNSGDISSRVSACARLSARATVWRVSAEASGPSARSTIDA